MYQPRFIHNRADKMMHCGSNGITFRSNKPKASSQCSQAQLSDIFPQRRQPLVIYFWNPRDLPLQAAGAYQNQSHQSSMIVWHQREYREVMPRRQLIHISFAVEPYFKAGV